MKLKTIIIILLLALIPIKTSYSEIKNMYVYDFSDNGIYKVKEKDPNKRMRLPDGTKIHHSVILGIEMEEGKIVYSCTTNETLIGIYAELEGKPIWKNRKVKIGKPENNGKANYYFYFEIKDSNGSSICKNPSEIVVKKEYELRKTKSEDENRDYHLIILFKKSFVEKLRDGRYKLNAVIYERGRDGKFKRIEDEDNFVFLKLNNPKIIDSRPYIYSLAGSYIALKYWEDGYDKDVKLIAEKLLTKAVELNVKLLYVYHDLIKLLLEDKKYKEAIEVLDKWMNIREKAIDLMAGYSLKDTVPIEKNKLLKILKKVYGDKAELELKKYYPDDKKKD